MTKLVVRGSRAIRRALLNGAWLLVVGLPVACASGTSQLPDPRPIVIHSGARIRVDKSRMDSINGWVTAEEQDIFENPNFWIITDGQPGEWYPWSDIRFGDDSVTIRVDPASVDAAIPFDIYAHLHLMVRMGHQKDWLQEAPEATGFELERAILARVADSWLLQRTVFAAIPTGPLDEIMYAHEEGYLDALIFTARPNEFTEARAAWARANPGLADEYRSWFVETFNREPPGLR